MSTETPFEAALHAGMFSKLMNEHRLEVMERPPDIVLDWMRERARLGHGEAHWPPDEAQLPDPKLRHPLSVENVAWLLIHGFTVTAHEATFEGGYMTLKGHTIEWPDQ